MFSVVTFLITHFSFFKLRPIKLIKTHNYLDFCCASSFSIFFFSLVENNHMDHLPLFNSVFLLCQVLFWRWGLSHSDRLV